MTERKVYILLGYYDGSDECRVLHVSLHKSYVEHKAKEYNKALVTMGMGSVMSFHIIQKPLKTRLDLMWE
jgi:hypothetical protein